jgi:hypothetical protein
MYVVKPLADCYRDCPSTEVVDEQASCCSEWMIEEADKIFLHSLGVKFPDA